MSRRHVIGAGLALLLATGGAYAQDGRVTGQRRLVDDLQMFSQILNQLRVNHPDSIDPHELMMAAIEGMVRAADPHSYVLPAFYLSPERQEAMDKGRLHPLPVQFIFVDDAPVIASVNPGSAAANLDLLPGDEVIAVDGRPVMERSAAELELALSGEKGTGVRLALERRRQDGSTVQLDRTVIREEASEEVAVVADVMLDDTTGYVRVSHFANEDAADEFHDALGDLKKQGMMQLVLDLRDNGGGRVDEAARVAGEFLPRGTVVYTAEGRKEEVTDTVKVGRSFWKREERYPVVVLVNEGTASAAELVAGALQDHDRAVIVGRPTYGKSLLMQGFPLTDGSIIMMVIGHVKTPCGRVVQRRYRGVSNREYRRAAGSVRDTTGLPSCRTASGRTVYGGGGIYPDVLLPTSDPEPRWLNELRERQIVLRWLGAFVEDSTTIDSEGGVSSVALANFLSFARGEGVGIPSDAASEELVRAVVAGHLAWHLGGQLGYYSAVAVKSPTVAAAVAEMERARLLIVR